MGALCVTGIMTVRKRTHRGGSVRSRVPERASEDTFWGRQGTALDVDEGSSRIIRQRRVVSSKFREMVGRHWRRTLR